ncbi:MAG: hypothetical protein ACR2QQ_15340 [Gammaproteobacteria bacterium]
MYDEQDPRAELLDERVARMKRELMPERDLWPEISSRLEPRDGTASASLRASQPRGWVSLGIAVAAGYLLATWFPLQSLLVGAGQPSQPAQLREEFFADSQPALAQLPVSTRAIVETDLAGFERDWLRIEEASAADPDNQLLQELLMSADDRARALRDRLSRLTGDSADVMDI